jgi:hypothetical protein
MYFEYYRLLNNSSHQVCCIASYKDVVQKIADLNMIMEGQVLNIWNKIDFIHSY